MSKVLPSIPTHLLTVSMGMHGATLISDATARTGDWSILYALTDCTFDAGAGVTVSTTIKVNGGSLPGDLASVALGKGCVLHGRFTKIKLSAGSLVAYNTEPFAS